MPLKSEVSDNLTGEWKAGLFESPCKNPSWFCFGCCCTCCATALQRHEILDVVGEPYVCCGGMCPCGPLGEEQDRNCAWLEACCCTGMAIAANRMYVQTRFDRRNTACDDCILWTTCIISFCVCLASIVCELPDGVQECVDCMIMTVDGCMIAQHKIELDFIKSSGGYHLPSTRVINALPDKQRELVQQGKPQQQMMGTTFGT
eukprot:TRINITY_DN16191_c0_g1_i1.p1 TRINITY_DN16191_c0_g1~~TRINITY_DN16191_c0_g1_i1.p1  ORF type:complete len:203 (-),score=36.19 TRINITY_DN16191_c0_g1_i1:125-733(-)